MRLVGLRPGRVFQVITLVSLGLLAACKSSPSTPAASVETVTVSGTVTYTRVPLAKSAAGVPLGLETDSAKFESKPARGVQVRFYKSVEETAADGTKVTVWQLAASDTFTDPLGKFTTSVPKDVPVFVEVVSRVGTAVRLIADPGGMNSSLNQADRPVYLLRKGLDGSSSTTNPTPATKASANVTVDFSVGVQDKWWLGVTHPSLVSSATLEAQGTGSRVLGILDSIYSFQSLYGRVLPGSAGDTLDLHYRPGLSELRGTYVEYDRSRFPQAFDSFTNSRHYFGSVRGASANDDAWDEAQLFLLLGRNNQAFLWSSALPPVGQGLTHLAPDLALAEGLARTMAANLLKSPYLADTAGAGATVLDIRDRSGLSPDQIGPYSAPNLGALGWELLLAANSIASPGTAETWANLNSSAMVRFFAVVLPKSTSDSTKVVDTYSIYGQLKRLQESQATGEPVNLSSIFTDAALTPLVAPYGLTWPRPTTGEHATYLLDWGTDPNSQATALPSISLSMARAAQVFGSYPNASEREVAYAQFYLTKDSAYNVQVLTQPAILPAGVAVEVYFPGLARTLTFTGGDAPTRLVFAGNSTTPVSQMVRVRVLSPNQVAPDILATVQFNPAS